MVESLKAYIGESARELVAWATGKGAQFALNLALALVIFAVGAIAIRIAAKFLRRGLEGRVKSNQMLVSFVVSVAVKRIADVGVASCTKGVYGDAAMRLQPFGKFVEQEGGVGSEDYRLRDIAQ